MTGARSADTTPQVARNIATIARLEQEALQQRSFGDRVSIAIARFFGTLKFVGIQVAWFVVWIVLNRESSPYRFDPYPYNLLMLIVGLEAILLSTFVLISQRQMTKLAERRSQLTLQIDLLAEVEMTKMLATLQAITEHLGMTQEQDSEMQDLSQPTEVEMVVRALDEQLPDPGAPGGRS